MNLVAHKGVFCSGEKNRKKYCPLKMNTFQSRTTISFYNPDRAVLHPEDCHVVQTFVVINM